MLRMFKLPLFFLFLLCLLICSSHANAATRNNPKEKPEDTVTWPSVDKMLGAMLMFGFQGTQLDANSKFGKLLKEGKIANVILFDRDVTSGGSRNIQNPEQLRKLCGQLKEAGALFIGVDQEGGQVRRLKVKNGFVDLPSAQAMGQASSHETMEKASQTGQELRSLGINVDFAPVADVDVNPYNPVIGRLGRAFNSDPNQVAMHALAFGRGLAKNGVIPVLKHFPGQGCAEKDSHLEPTDISACWKSEVDLLPYAEIFQKGWPGMVMTGHLLQKNLDPDNPATLSSKIIDGLLRNGLGWQGVVISDDMQMEAVGGRELKDVMLAALDAGVDILLFGNNIKWDEDLPEKALAALHALMDENRLTEERLRQSWKRISALAEVYNLLPQTNAASSVNQVEEAAAPK